MKRWLAVIGLTAAGFGLGCRDEVPNAPPGTPNLAISDAVHSSGNAHFFFLPPMVSQPVVSGVFDDIQSPVVTICELSADANPACVRTIATFTMSTGITVDANAGEYQANWHAGDANLSLEKNYRIGIAVAGTTLGYADVDVVGSGKELKNVNTGEFIGLVDNRTLPIKFRIERGAVSVVGADGGTVTSEDGNATLIFPPGALPGATGITVQAANIPPGDLGPKGLVGGTGYDFGPNGSEFPAPGITLTLKYDPANLGGLDESHLVVLVQLPSGWAEIPASVVDQANHTVTAHLKHFTQYTLGINAPLHFVDRAPVIHVGQDLDPVVSVPYMGRSVTVFSRKQTIASSDPATGVVHGVAPGAALLVATSYDPNSYLDTFWYDEVGLTVLPASVPTGELYWSVQAQGVIPNGLLTIWGSSNTDIWAAGTSGTIIHSDGSTLPVRVASGTSQLIRTLWGRSGSEIYAVGNANTFLKYNGSSWAPMSPTITGFSGTFNSISGNSTYLFVATGGGFIYRYDGGASWGPPVFTLPGGGTFRAISVDGSHVVAAGQDASGNGVLVSSQDNGATWSAPALFGQQIMFAVYQDPINQDVIAVGNNGSIVGSYDDGVSWRYHDQTMYGLSQFLTVTGDPGGGNTIWVGGTRGELCDAERRINGCSGNHLQFTYQDVQGLWRAPSGVIYGVGSSGVIFRRVGLSSTFVTLYEGQALQDVWGTSPTDVMIASGSVHSEIFYTSSGGAMWDRFYEPVIGQGFTSIWANSITKENYEVGPGRAVRYFNNQTGGTLLTVPGSASFNDVWGFSQAGNSPVWIVGSAGTIMKTTNAGASWSSQASGTTQDLWAVSGANATNVFAAGAGGDVVYTTNGGTSWTRIRTGAGEGINGMFAVSPTEAYVAAFNATQGVLLRCMPVVPGGAPVCSNVIRAYPTGIPRAFGNVWSSSPTDVWVVGTGGFVSHWDGSTWIDQPKVTNADYASVWGSGPNNLFVVGIPGTIIRGVR